MTRIDVIRNTYSKLKLNSIFVQMTFTFVSYESDELYEFNHEQHRYMSIFEADSKGGLSR